MAVTMRWCSADDIVERVRALTGGEGVPVVYDSIGKATFEDSLRCLRRRGILASFGEASGDPDPVPPRRLGQLGSLYVTHPSLGDYTATREALVETANDLFNMVMSGKVRIDIDTTIHLPRRHVRMPTRGAQNHRLDCPDDLTIMSDERWQTRTREELKAENAGARRSAPIRCSASP
jgi:NADPH:quinone reductase-like Zn-dependent oxidoreductase